jgi:class 3 adenylate cyclase
VGEEPRPQDEMRPITALFADIVGSTGLGERLGPDEVKALVGECVTRMSRARLRRGDQAFMGDGIAPTSASPRPTGTTPSAPLGRRFRIAGVAPAMRRGGGGVGSRASTSAWG